MPDCFRILILISTSIPFMDLMASWAPKPHSLTTSETNLFRRVITNYVGSRIPLSSLYNYIRAYLKPCAKSEGYPQSLDCMHRLTLTYFDTRSPTPSKKGAVLCASCGASRPVSINFKRVVASCFGPLGVAVRRLCLLAVVVFLSTAKVHSLKQSKHMEKTIRAIVIQVLTSD